MRDSIYYISLYGSDIEKSLLLRGSDIRKSLLGVGAKRVVAPFVIGCFPGGHVQGQWRVLV
jgi:hypothetical protein